MNQSKRTFLSDAIDMASLCAHSLENDKFSECFKPVPRFRMFNSGILYVFSFVTRYFILFPIRFVALCLGTTLTALVFFYGLFTHNELTISLAFTLFFRLFVLVFSCHIKHQGVKKRMKLPHIYISNHTSFIDFMLLSSHKFCHACISEMHGGLFGFIFNTIISKNGSIAFKRSEKHDRKSVAQKLREHILKNKTPMLIFPEGTCVNNEYTVLFQKGAFELDALVCPVAIKYKKELMDPYWNRREQCFTRHLFYLMTRWRIDAEIFWLDPVKKAQEESSIEFAHRVKNLIAEKAGLRNTLWNGMFKSSPVLQDREYFRLALLSVYNKIRKGVLAESREEDIAEGRFYLLNKNTFIPKKDSKIYFNEIGHSQFVNECCKEYLRMKAAKYLNTGILLDDAQTYKHKDEGLERLSVVQDPAQDF